MPLDRIIDIFLAGCLAVAAGMFIGAMLAL